MKITTKRHTTHKKLYKNDRDLVIGAGRHNSQLLDDLTALIPMRAGNVRVSDVDRSFIGDGMGVPPVEKVYTRYQVFHDDPVLETQVYIGLIYSAMREDRNVYDAVVGTDWSDNVVTREKRDVLTQLKDYISSALTFDVDLIDFFSESVKDLISVREDLKKPEVLREGFNINLPMFFRLLQSFVIVVRDREPEYINGTAILYAPFKSDAESPLYICQNSREKPLCVVQYFMDKTPPVSYTHDLTMLTKEHLDMVSPEIYQKLGYNNIYEYIVKGLNLS